MSGRPKGHWWKWKRAALTVDCVLMYASAAPANARLLFGLHFGVWRETDGDTATRVR